MARGFEMAVDRVQAIECICVEFLHSHYLALLALQEGMTPYQLAKTEAVIHAGFRCIKCETSQNLTPHHIWPRSYHGPERPDNIDSTENLAILCLKCHEEITPRWREWIPRLIEMRRKAELDMAAYGFRQTAKHAGKTKLRWT